MINNFLIFHSVPANRVEIQCMNLLQEEINLISQDNMELRTFLEDYLSYVRQTWIFGNYPITEWNQFDSTSMQHLTNNASGKLYNTFFL